MRATFPLSAAWSRRHRPRLPLRPEAGPWEDGPTLRPPFHPVWKEDRRCVKWTTISSLYLPSIARKSSLKVPSRHRRYLEVLKKKPRFRDFSQSRPQEAITQLEERITRHSAELGRMHIVHLHNYSQALDIRLYHQSMSAAGWCLGISSYWLKNKKNAVDIFPHAIYTTPELCSRHGAPIKLMSNQDKLLKYGHGRVDHGRLDLSVKNVLDYVAGGRATNRPPVTTFDMTRGTDLRRKMAYRFFRQLAPQRASREEKDRDLFLISQTTRDGDKHMMALDANAMELFDPNFGVFTVSNGRRPVLIDFLFVKFHDMFYPGTPITSIAVYRAG